MFTVTHPFAARCQQQGKTDAILRAFRAGQVLEPIDVTKHLYKVGELTLVIKEVKSLIADGLITEGAPGEVPESEVEPQIEKPKPIPAKVPPKQIKKPSNEETQTQQPINQNTNP